MGEVGVRRILAASIGCALLLWTHGVVARAMATPPSSTSPSVVSGRDRCAALAEDRSSALGIVSAGLSSTRAHPGDAAAVRSQIEALPVFCRVVGRIRPEPGSDIDIEVWLPETGWDGRLHGSGNGGFAGVIDYQEMASAIRAGQAVVATDTGHTGTAVTSDWAKGHPERVRDYGWRAIHLAAVAAKRLIATFYGRGPDHSYFVSCSNGGRQGLMEASRFPEDYDGVVAGDPAASWTDLAMSAIWTVQAQAAPGAALRADQLEFLQARVIADCDAVDGQVDGLVADPRRCRVDYAKLACGPDAAAHCFGPDQIDALKKIYAGPQDRYGRQVAPAFPPSGGEAARNNWDSYILSSPTRPSNDAGIGAAFLPDLPPTPLGDVLTFDYDRDPVRLKAALSADLDVRPDLHAFFDHGGKLILYHGWADAAIPPAATLEFRDAILRASGTKAKSSMALFMVPGMQHCFGGPGPNTFGQFGAPLKSATPTRSVGAAITAWVEEGRKPDRLEASVSSDPKALFADTQAEPARERLLCAYPLAAVLKAGADPDRAASYVCSGADTTSIGRSARSD